MKHSTNYSHLRLANVIIPTFLLFLLCFGFRAEGQNLDTVPYFPEELMPDATFFLPAPPDTNSQLFIDDFSQWLWGKSMRGTARGSQASWESLYGVERMCGIYSEALGFTVNRRSTPAIYRLISRGELASSAAVDRAKAHFLRLRPFARMGEHVAGAFDDEEHLRGNGSYPSGHTSLGWTTALILAQMAPEMQDTILRRGWEYGESRVIVGAHWQSDVDAARLAASAAVARIQASPEYQSDLAAARQEFLAWHGSVPQNVGYPNGRHILPPPIDTADRRYQGDVAAHWAAKALRNTERGTQAIIDADLGLAECFNQLSACLNMAIDSITAPHIAEYLMYVRFSVMGEANELKNRLYRKRPFMQLGEETLIPDEEELLGASSSYPSGHSAMGWATALAVVEMTPDSMNAVLQRGYEIGQSRVITGYHWLSDVQAGRLVASYAMMRLSLEPRFKALLDSARAEYEGLRGYVGIGNVESNDGVTLLRQGENVVITFDDVVSEGEVSVYSVDGRLMFSQPVSGETVVRLSPLPHGVYLVNYSSNRGSCCLKTVR